VRHHPLHEVPHHYHWPQRCQWRYYIRYALHEQVSGFFIMSHGSHRSHRSFSYDDSYIVGRWLKVHFHTSSNNRTTLFPNKVILRAKWIHHKKLIDSLNGRRLIELWTAHSAFEPQRSCYICLDHQDLCEFSIAYSEKFYKFSPKLYNKNDGVARICKPELSELL
jgi:hypothetical protein